MIQAQMDWVFFDSTGVKETAKIKDFVNRLTKRIYKWYFTEKKSGVIFNGKILSITCAFCIVWQKYLIFVIIYLHEIYSS